MDQYLSALVAHDPSKLPLSPTVKFTENSAPLKIGDGLWQTTSSLGTYKLYLDEPATGEVGAFVLLGENDVPALMALRLKVANRRMDEIESLIVRKGEGQNLSTDLLSEPLPILLETVPEQERLSRSALVGITDSYFNAIEQGNGKLVPFDPAGFRIENGVRTCNVRGGTPNPNANPAFARFRTLPCADQLSTGIFNYIRSISPRRYPVVDPEEGLVMAIIRFNHPGDVKSVEVAGVGTVSMANNPWASHPTSALIAEIFKIERGEIKVVMAAIVKVPYREPVGWDGE